MHVDSIDPHSDKRWFAYVQDHPDGMIFHHPRWMRVLEQAYGYRQASVACFDGDRIVGLVPLLEIRSAVTGSRAVGLPFSDYGPILTHGDDVAVRLSEHLRESAKAKRWKYVEIRGDAPGGAVAAAYKRHRVALQADPEALFRTFDKKSVRYTLHKFAKTGVIVERRTDPNAMQAFMQLNYQTRKKHGIPPQPDSFFRLFHELLIADGLGFINLALHNGKPIAASVFLCFHGVVYHKYNASEESMLHLSPNHGLMWDVIQWACGAGYRELDLGRSDLDGSGLIRYKRAWGAEESDLSYVRIPPDAVGHRNTSGGLLSVMKPVMRHLPIPLLKVVGKVLYEHAG